MGRRVVRDSNPANDYQDGYSAGRRYFSRKLKALLKLVKKGKK